MCHILHNFPIRNSNFFEVGVSHSTCHPNKQGFRIVAPALVIFLHLHICMHILKVNLMIVCGLIKYSSMLKTPTICCLLVFFFLIIQTNHPSSPKNDPQTPSNNHVSNKGDGGLMAMSNKNMF